MKYERTLVSLNVRMVVIRRTVRNFDKTVNLNVVNAGIDREQTIIV